MIKYISFDLDGTLVSEEFDNQIWNVKIPEIYSKTHNVDLKIAEDFVFAEYYRAFFLEREKKYTDLEYWFERLQIGGWQELMNSLKDQAFVFKDVFDVLKKLKKSSIPLIIFTSADKKFIDFKLEKSGLTDLVDEVISTTSDFNLPRKDFNSFKRLLERLKIQADEIIHIGNEVGNDFEEPSKIGIKSILIDRENKLEKKDYVLNKFEDLLSIHGLL